MSPLILDPRIRVTSTMMNQSACNRDARALTTLSGSLIIFEEGDFEPGPPPIFTVPCDLLPVPSYDHVAQEVLPPIFSVPHDLPPVPSYDDVPGETLPPAYHP